MAFKPRTSAPSTSDKNWIHTSKGGKNSCILISGNSVLPNCVGYAWGRFMEILGTTPKLSRGNAENWWGYKDGYERGQTPRLGAVMCYRKGKAGVSSDGAGHVLIVEGIYSDGSVLVSQSGYRSSRFWTSIIPAGYALKGYVFQGFIYNPAVKDNTVVDNSSTYVAGKNYILTTNLKVRSGAGTNYTWKTVNQLTAGGKKAATSSNSSDKAVLKSGTVVTALSVIKSGNNIWLKIPSGYICANEGGSAYVKSATSSSNNNSTSNYKAGKNYTLQTVLKVRTGPGTNYSQKIVGQLTAGGKKAATSSSEKSKAALKKGTIVTAQKVVVSGNNIWLQIPSGYVCAKEGKSVYIK